MNRNVSIEQQRLADTINTKYLHQGILKGEVSLYC